MPNDLTLSVLESGRKELTVMRSLLNLAGGGAEGGSWTIIDRSGGNLTVVDVDSPTGEERWQQLVQRGECPIALTRRKEFEAHYLLHKPIRARAFLNLLEELSLEVLSNEESQPAMPEWVEEVPEPSAPQWQCWETDTDRDWATLAEHLRRQTWNVPVVLLCKGWPQLVIDPCSGTWYYDGSISDLRPEVFAEEIPAMSGVPISSSDMVERVSDMRQRALSELKWYAGLAQSRGKLHPDLVDEVEFMLPQVPPLALNKDCYQHMARILIRGPITLDELHRQAGETVENVACFLNACYTTGRLLINQPARAVSF